MYDIVDFKALKFALKHYSPSQMCHALQVAEYAVEDNSYLASEKELRKLWKIGVLHDILEDTDCPVEELKSILTGFEFSTVQLLTHNKREISSYSEYIIEISSYSEYIMKIVKSDNFYAKAVKRADMKDHLSREATLTDYLKDKYYPVIKYLL